MSSAVSHEIDDYESLLVALQNVLGVVVPDEQRSNLVERIERPRINWTRWQIWLKSYRVREVIFVLMCSMLLLNVSQAG